MKTYITFLLVCLCIASLLYGQKRPFPQNIKYPHGFLSSKISTKKLESWYASYKNQKNLLQPCNGGLMPAVEGGVNSKVEAQGWAMITAAYMGEKDDFDGLYRYYTSKCNDRNGGMMDWNTNCGGTVQRGSATDGDMDVGFALIVAYWQWGGDYLDKAKKVIKNLRKLITTCDGVSVLHGGYSGGPYGGCKETDISYYTPAFFRVFAEVTNDKAWTKLADDTYTILNKVAHNKTGLVPDWHKWNGGRSEGSHSHAYYYHYDACRVPWRITIDYLWNGNEKAKAWCAKVTNWAASIGPSNIKSGYDLDGSNPGEYHNMSFVGAFAVGAMCNSQKVLDDFSAEVETMPYDNFWYHSYLGNCYLLALTGNMWRPDIVDKQMDINKISIRELNRNIKITLAPSQKLIVTGNKDIYSVTISNMLGGDIIRSSAPDNGRLFLDVSTVKPGVYLVNTSAKNGKLFDSRKMIFGGADQKFF